MSSHQAVSVLPELRNLLLLVSEGVQREPEMLNIWDSSLTLYSDGTKEVFPACKLPLPGEEEIRMQRSAHCLSRYPSPAHGNAALLSAVTACALDRQCLFSARAVPGTAGL